MEMLGRIQSPSANREGLAQSLNSPLRHQEALRLECSPQVSAPVAGNRPLTKQLFQGSRVQLPEGLDPIGATFVVSAACGRIGDKALDVRRCSLKRHLWPDCRPTATFVYRDLEKNCVRDVGATDGGLSGANLHASPRNRGNRPSRRAGSRGAIKLQESGTAPGTG